MSTAAAFRWGLGANCYAFRVSGWANRTFSSTGIRGFCSGSKGETGYPDLRRTMRHVPSSVSVVTVGGIAGGKVDSANSVMRGMTCSSLTSVSLFPPIVSFCVKVPSALHNALSERRQFMVNVLNEDQKELSAQFSKHYLTGAEQFENVKFSIDEASKAPILQDCLTSIQCDVYREPLEVGDHIMWFGLVKNIFNHIPEIDEERNHPLLYFNRSYRKLGKRL
eukprot:Nk52_evm77s226 gene=Nk52_evmTU77s226